MKMICSLNGCHEEDASAQLLIRPQQVELVVIRTRRNWQREHSSSLDALLTTSSVTHVRRAIFSLAPLDFGFWRLLKSLEWIFYPPYQIKCVCARQEMWNNSSRFKAKKPIYHPKRSFNENTRRTHFFAWRVNLEACGAFSFFLWRSRAE